MTAKTPSAATPSASRPPLQIFLPLYLCFAVLIISAGVGASRLLERYGTHPGATVLHGTATINGCSHQMFGPKYLCTATVSLERDPAYRDTHNSRATVISHHALAGTVPVQGRCTARPHGRKHRCGRVAAADYPVQPINGATVPVLMALLFLAGTYPIYRLARRLAGQPKVPAGPAATAPTTFGPTTFGPAAFGPTTAVPDPTAGASGVIPTQRTGGNGTTPGKGEDAPPPVDR